MPFSVGKEGATSDAVTKALIENNVYGAFVHTAFGGMSFNHKDRLLLSETLAARDLSIFTSVDHVHMAVNILETYGTSEQREKFLPRIASGQCKPALCFLDDT